MENMTFMEMLEADMVEEGGIDNFIDDYYDAYAEFGGPGFMPLWDFLGMTPDEYNVYLKKGCDCLKEILQDRKKTYD